MRVFFGMILGALLTVSAAYVYDANRTDAAGLDRPMVNWDVVGELASRQDARPAGMDATLRAPEHLTLQNFSTHGLSSSSQVHALRGCVSTCR